MVFPTVRKYWTNAAGLLRRGAPRWALAAAVAVLGAAPAAATESSLTVRLSAPPGVLVSVSAHQWYGEWTGDEGSNPRYTEAAFSTMEYYVEAYTRIYDGLLFLQPKTSEELNALASPPPDPFTVTVEVTMTNDEGETATGTLKFKTDYASASDDETVPSLTTNPQPYQVRWTAITAEPGTTVTIYAVNLFASAGTNPKITDAVFSTTEYYDTHEVRDGLLRVQSKSAADLNALASPPSDPFTVEVRVTMANDEGQTASGTINFETTYGGDG